MISRRILARTIAHYQQNYSDTDGRYRATFDIVYMVGFAPAESQPKPLKPGSAKMRLADALRARGETLRNPQKPSRTD